MPDNSHLTIAESDTIEQAFQRLNANMLGILFARDAGGRVIGAVTDGDIRRRLLTGISIQNRLSVRSLPGHAPSFQCIWQDFHAT